MNLIDDSEVKSTKLNEQKAQKLLIGLVVVIAILVIFAVLIMLKMQQTRNEQLKFNVDGKSSNISKTLFEKDANGNFRYTKSSDGTNTYYFSVREFKKLSGFSKYTANVGLPGQYIEHDYANAYIEDNNERVVFSANEKKITKYEKLNDNSIEEIEISDSIVQEGYELYAPQDAIESAFNCQISYNASTNTFNVYTLEYLTQKFIDAYPLTPIKYSDQNMDYTTFSNLKAIVRGYLIIQDPNNKYQGVMSLENTEATKSLQNQNEISDTNVLLIGAKYQSIRYMEGSNNFYVTTTDKKVGILDSNAQAVVQPIYLFIDELDSTSGEYVAQSDNKLFGVINKNGKPLIPFDYDQIGLDDTMDDPNVTNKYLLLNSFIPAKKNGQYMFFSKQGTRLLGDKTYAGIGYQNNSEQNGSGTRSVVVIPEIKSIVISYLETEKGVDGKDTVKKYYGIIGDSSSSDSAENFNFDMNYFTQIYAIQSNNKTTYMGVQQGNTIDIVSYVTEYRSNARTNSTNNDSNQVSGDQTQEDANAEQNAETSDEVNGDTESN